MKNKINMKQESSGHKKEKGHASRREAKKKQVITENGRGEAKKKQVITEGGREGAKKKQVITESGRGGAKKKQVITEGGREGAKKKQVITEDSRREDKKKQLITEGGRGVTTYSGGGVAARKTGAARPAKLCPYDKKCGACVYISESYEKQLKIKQEKLDLLLKKFCKVNPIIGMENPYHYRNKVHAVFDRDRKGNVISGTYQEGTHRVVPIDTCMIENKKADDIILTVRSLVKPFKIRIYDEDTGYGLLRHVLVKYALKTEQIMVVLVTASPVFPSKNNFVKALREKHPEITTIIQNINPRGTSAVLGDREHILYGKGYIEDSLSGCIFRISAKSFYQVNPVQTEKLYSKALELANLKGTETVIDAYCGIGTIALIAASHAKEIIGVELNKDAVRDAKYNVKANGIGNVWFCAQDAGLFITAMAEQGKQADVLFMDPPRSGSTEVFMDSAALLAPDKIIYISCNPITLERDIKYFIKKGYMAKEAWPVDMFPWSGHVECVCLMTRTGK